AGADQAVRPGAPEEDGYRRPGSRLRDRGPGTGEEHHLRLRRRHRRLHPARRALLRRGHAHPHARDDHDAAPGPLHRHDPREGRSRRQDQVLVELRTSRRPRHHGACAFVVFRTVPARPLPLLSFGHQTHGTARILWPTLLSRPTLILGLTSPWPFASFTEHFKYPP